MTDAPVENDFDVSLARPPVSSASPPVEEAGGDESDDVEAEAVSSQPQELETPEQRRLMRAKRIAKAEEEHLRRLTRQYPVVARLVLEIEMLKQHFKK